MGAGAAEFCDDGGWSEGQTHPTAHAAPLRGGELFYPLLGGVARRAGVGFCGESVSCSVSLDFLRKKGEEIGKPDSVPFPNKEGERSFL